MNKERLLNVAKALRESPDPDKFTMRLEVTNDGEPCCAWAHYVKRPDLQDAFIEMDPDGYVRSKTATGMTYADSQVLNHFGITEDQAESLFGQEGCAEARTTDEAAEYIERFVAHNS